jgi:cell wall-associated NlpC family hydrolase
MMSGDGRATIRAAAAAVASIALAACVSAPPRATAPLPAAPVSGPAGSTAAPQPERRTLLVDNAMSMLGQPYRFGGAAPGGFDCSGLVVYAAGGAGIRVPRTAREQLHTGRPVPRGAVRGGDLVFLHLARKELHVGIAIDAERFVHAPSAGGYVRVDTLGAPPYAKGFVGARRIISAP